MYILITLFVEKQIRSQRHHIEFINLIKHHHKWRTTKWIALSHFLLEFPITITHSSLIACKISHRSTILLLQESTLMFMNPLMMVWSRWRWLFWHSALREGHRAQHCSLAREWLLFYDACNPHLDTRPRVFRLCVVGMLCIIKICIHDWNNSSFAKKKTHQVLTLACLGAWQKKSYHPIWISQKKKRS